MYDWQLAKALCPHTTRAGTSQDAKATGPFPRAGIAKGNQGFFASKSRLIADFALFFFFSLSVVFFFMSLISKTARE